MKICNKCKINKDQTDFYQRRNAQSGYDSTCKECRKEHQRNNKENHRLADRKYYEENKDKRKANAKIWTENNHSKVLEYRRNRKDHRKPRKRIRKYNPETKRLENQRRRTLKNSAAGTTSKLQLRLRIEMWGGLCYLCGNKYEAIDHVIPLSRGGTNYPANLRPICKSCNSVKGIKNWRQYI